jgi:hypothetical protein
MASRLHRLLKAALLFAFVVTTLWGCRSAPEPAPERDATQRRLLRPAAPEPPPAEELANNPCGNPNWAKLPGERGEEAPVDDEDDQRD